MKFVLPYYDIKSILLPGFLMLCSIVLLCDIDIFSNNVNHFEFAGIIIVLLVSYLLGECLQVFSKYFIEKPFIILGKGLPAMWILSANRLCAPIRCNSLAICGLTIQAKIKKDILQLRNSYEKDAHETNLSCKQIKKLTNESLLRDLICQIVTWIKGNVCLSEDLAKTRAHAKMYRSLCCILLIDMILVWYNAYSHGLPLFHFNPPSGKEGTIYHFFSHEHILIFLALVFLACFFRYRCGCINYARKIFYCFYHEHICPAIIEKTKYLAILKATTQGGDKPLGQGNKTTSQPDQKNNEEPATEPDEGSGSEPIIPTE